MGEIRHLIRQWLCGRKGHGELYPGEGGFYCTRCGKQTMTFDEFGEAVMKAIEKVTGGIIAYLDDLKARMEKQDKARREMYLQAVEAEERQVAKAREILGGD